MTHSTENHENNSTEDADMIPPRVLQALLGGVLFQGALRSKEINHLLPLVTKSNVFSRMEGIMKKMSSITVVAICSFLIVLSTKTPDVMADPGGFSNYRLTKLWVTKADLRVPESVLYNPSDDILYVSNINGKPAEKTARVLSRRYP